MIITANPNPPTHCVKERYTSKLLGVEDKSWIIVEPVVVKPEKLSNNASLKKKTLLNKK